MNRIIISPTNGGANETPHREYVGREYGGTMVGLWDVVRKCDIDNYDSK